MPRNPVINRRNVRPMRQWTAAASPEAITEVRRVADLLNVSQASLVDTALQQLVTLAPAQIAAALVEHGHLTADEHTEVLARLQDKQHPGRRARRERK